MQYTMVKTKNLKLSIITIKTWEYFHIKKNCLKLFSDLKHVYMHDKLISFTKFSFVQGQSKWPLVED